jgi:HAMP domain-containing protein
VVVVGTLLDANTAQRSAHLVEAFQSYRQIEIQKGEFKQSYLLTFVLVTLLVLLGSSWMGLFLARRMVTPLQELGEAFRRVSSGELDQRIAAPADDEMREVVDSFHRMTDELARSRAEIERSTREMQLVNRAPGCEPLARRGGRVRDLGNLAAGVRRARRRRPRAPGTARRCACCASAPASWSGARSRRRSQTTRARAAAAACRRGGAPVAGQVPVAGTWRTFELSSTGPARPGRRWRRWW